MNKITILIPSRNRPISLSRCLKSLNNHREYIGEVIVSNDSDKKYLEIYNKLAKKYNFELIEGPRKGLYANHNHMYKKANYSHVRVVDDDHTFPKDHFKFCMEAIKKDPLCVWSIGEKYPKSEKVYFPRELNSRGFSSETKSFDDNAALACGSSIYPRSLFTEKKIFHIENYKFGMTWLEYALRIRKLGVKIKILTNTYVTHYYNKNNRSFNSTSIDLETKFFVILVYNFIYKKKLKNQFLGLYEILKELIFFKPIKLICLKNSIKVFFKLKKKGLWNFNIN